MNKKLIEKYKHHDIDVFVDSRLKGKHRKHCLCYNCKKFIPDDVWKNCSIAAELFEVCIENGLVTPVYECPEFEDKRTKFADIEDWVI